MRPVLLAALALLTLPVGGAFGAEKNEQSRADGEAWMGLLSFPFDLVLDAVLTPVDLVAWAFGVRKGGWPC